MIFGLGVTKRGGGGFLPLSRGALNENFQISKKTLKPVTLF